MMKERVCRVIKLMRKKEVALAFLVVVLLSAVLGVPIHWLLQGLQQQKVNVIVAQIRQIVATERAELSEKTKKISQDKTLSALVAQGNVAKINVFLQQLKEQQQLDLATLTDENGLVLARAGFSSKSGDYVFQSTAWGQVLAEQKSFVSVEKSNIVPLAFIAGAPIFYDNKFIGTITTGYLMDDKFAQAMKNKYKLVGGEVVIYSVEEAVVGSSFSDQEYRKIVEVNASSGSDLIKKTEPGQHFVIGGKSFILQNIPFDGLNGSVGGMLVFWPDEEIKINLIAAALLALLFVILFGLILRKLHVRHFKMIVIYGAMAVLVGGFIANYFVSELKIINLTKPAITIYNSTLSIEPSSALINKSFSYQVAIKVATGGESVNAVTIALDFNPELVKVGKIIITNSMCKPEMFVEKIIDNVAGRVDISCLAPSPGFSKSGIVAELELLPQSFGQFSLAFNNDSAVLANDGQGTDVLRLATGASYEIPVVTDMALTAISQPLLVFSTTHPNREKWYNNKRNINFTWFLPKIDESEYYYELNKIPEFVPKTQKNSTGRVSLFVKDDGIYYFHLAKYRQNQLVALVHYKIMIDATPPTRPEVRVNSGEIKVGDVVWFDFKSQDNLSGMQPNYYFKLDDGVLLPVASPLHLSFDKAGTHTVTIRAYDKADNFSETTVKIEVKK